MKGLRNGRKVRRSAVFGLVGALVVSMLATGIAQAATVTLNIEHYVFSPSPLTIVAGTTVKWVNKDPTQHQIVSDTGAFPSSKLLDTGQSYSVKFSKAGTFNYHDGFNAFIKGTIIVTGTPKATPKPTPRPTAKATPKPTPKATAAATASAPTDTAATAAPSTDTTVASPAPSDAGGAVSASSGTDGTAAPGGSSDGTATGSSGGSLDIGSIAVGLVLAVVLFFAWIGLQSFRRNRPGPPTSGGTVGGGDFGGSGGGSGGPGGGGASGGGGGSGGAGGGGGPTGSGATWATDVIPEAAPAPEPPLSPMSPATRRLVRRTGPVQPFDEDAPIGGG